jgi:hypothetical protein
MIIADVPRRAFKGMTLETAIEEMEKIASKMPKPKMLPEQYDAWEKYIREEYGAKKEKGANAKMYGGDHYLKMPIQPWDAIDGFDHAQAIGFYRGSALAYIMRAGSKGPAREDYEKALHYLEKLLEIL